MHHTLQYKKVLSTRSGLPLGTTLSSNLAMDFFLLSTIMDLRHQSTAMCHHVGGKDTPRDLQRKIICTSHYPSERVETKNQQKTHTSHNPSRPVKTSFLKSCDDIQA